MNDRQVRGENSGQARPRTAEELRNRIDSGLTGDKVRASDPAVAPLGTDDEAAGVGVPPQAVESAIPPHPNAKERKFRGHRSLRLYGGLLAAALAAATAAVVALLAA